MDVPLDATIQCYSFEDALNYFRYALTAEDKDVREKQFGNLFLSLGHIMHLVQDMAQPQHVRDDMHCDSEEVCKPLNHVVPGLYNPSYYEAYTFERATPS